MHNLCNEMNESDDEISTILRKVDNKIANDSNNKQLAEFQDRFLSYFYFKQKTEKGKKTKS